MVGKNLSKQLTKNQASKLIEIEDDLAQVEKQLEKDLEDSDE